MDKKSDAGWRGGARISPQRADQWQGDSGGEIEEGGVSGTLNWIVSETNRCRAILVSSQFCVDGAFLLNGRRSQGNGEVIGITSRTEIDIKRLTRNPHTKGGDASRQRKYHGIFMNMMGRPRTKERRGSEQRTLPLMEDPANPSAKLKTKSVDFLELQSLRQYLRFALSYPVIHRAVRNKLPRGIVKLLNPSEKAKFPDCESFVTNAATRDDRTIAQTVVTRDRKYLSKTLGILRIS
jgi:hypothetical protein